MEHGMEVIQGHKKYCVFFWLFTLRGKLIPYAFKENNRKYLLEKKII